MALDAAYHIHVCVCVCVCVCVGMHVCRNVSDSCPGVLAQHCVSHWLQRVMNDLLQKCAGEAVGGKSVDSFVRDVAARLRLAVEKKQFVQFRQAANARREKHRARAEKGGAAADPDDDRSVIQIPIAATHKWNHHFMMFDAFIVARKVLVVSRDVVVGAARVVLSNLASCRTCSILRSVLRSTAG
jgi:hypothetical protein